MRPELHLVDPDTGELVEPANYQDAIALVGQLRERIETAAELIKDKDERIARLRRDRTDHRRGEAARAVKDAEADDVREVLLYWRPHCMPKAKLIPDSPRWRKVAERLTDVDLDGEPAFTVQDLKDAVDGALQSDYHVENGYLDAETIFRDSGTVERHRNRLPDAWKPERFENGLVLDRETKRRLAALHPWQFEVLEECDCGHLRCQHVKNVVDGPMVGWWPCGECGCVDFDDFHTRAEAWLRERDRRHVRSVA